MSNEYDVLKNELDTLIAQRDIMEIESDAIVSELTSIGPNGEAPGGLSGPLIDSDGYPRGDIDLYNVRNKRHRLSVLNTDHKALMKRIEALLPQLFALHQINPSISINSKEGITTTVSSSSSSSSSSASNHLSVDSTTISIENLKSFAKIDQVLIDSPAYLGGIRDDDMLLLFGTIESSSSSSSETNLFNLIPDMLKQHINKELRVGVLRNGQEYLNLTAHPKTWSGRGVLGCHFSPLTA